MVGEAKKNLKLRVIIFTKQRQKQEAKSFFKRVAPENQYRRRA